VLFDLDGTIWDSMPGILRSLVHALDHVGVTPPPDEVLVGHIGPPLTVMLADVGVPPPLVDDARDAYRERYHAVGAFECVLYDHAATTLDRLRADGWALATATSKGEVATRAMLDHFELTERFDVIAAASMDSSSHSKLDVVRRAVAGLDEVDAKSTWMVGDRRYDVEGGRAAGLSTVGVTWGYAPPGELTAARPTCLAADFADVLDALEG
jgi:phosphoglycolate phosphatase